jgi:RNA polymerase sigma factor (sigma-70 family)
MGNRKKNTFNVDFQALEQRSYKNLSSLGKEIIDKFIELSVQRSGEEPKLSEQQQAKMDLIKEAMKELTDRQKQVLTLSFDLDGEGAYTERQIAEKLNISQVSVHELKTRAIESLKRKIVDSAPPKPPKKKPKKS